MDIKPLIGEIRKFMKENANADLVKKYSYYFKEGYDAYGVPQEIYFKFKDEFLEKNCSAMTMEEAVNLCNELFSSGMYEEGTLSILVLLHYKKQFGKNTLEVPSLWLDSYVRNWAHTDYLCGEIMSLLLLKKHITYEDLAPWRSAESKWKRRAVPVSMLKLLKETNDYSPFFEFITPMMMDPERVVHQGLGWFLRECWKKQPEQTEDFLLKWKNTAPRLIFQYATEKMTKENKERFRKDKVKKK